MASEEPVYFDMETVALLRETLEEAWACLPPERRATTSRTLLANASLNRQRRASAIQNAYATWL